MKCLTLLDLSSIKMKVRKETSNIENETLHLDGIDLDGILRWYDYLSPDTSFSVLNPSMSPRWFQTILAVYKLLLTSNNSLSFTDTFYTPWSTGLILIPWIVSFKFNKLSLPPSCTTKILSDIACLFLGRGTSRWRKQLRKPVTKANFQERMNKN
jgi:hypothetical protein